MITLYVDTASAGGNGTTELLTGGTAAFATLNAALASMPGTLTDAVTINCKGTAADTVGCIQSVFDFITSPTNYISIIGNNTSGKWDATKYRMEILNNSAIYNNDCSHVRLYNLQAMIKNTDGGSQNAYRLSTANNNTSGGTPYFIIKNCIARRDPTSTSGDVTGVINSICGDGSVTGKVYVINTTVYDTNSGSGAFNTDAGAWANANVFHYNCTVVGSNYGFLDCNNTRNCLAKSTFPLDFTGGSNHNYDASADGSAAGANSQTDQIFTFVDEGNDDFHLSVSDVGARGLGLTDPGSGLYSDDADGQTRSAPWDIGADQYVAVPIIMDALLRQRFYPGTKGPVLARRMARGAPLGAVPQTLVLSTTVFRKTLSGIGTKTGSRQTHNDN